MASSRPSRVTRNPALKSCELLSAFCAPQQITQTREHFMLKVIKWKGKQTSSNMHVLTPPSHKTHNYSLAFLCCCCLFGMSFMWPRLASNSWTSYLQFPNAEPIDGNQDNPCPVYSALGQSLGFPACYANSTNWARPLALGVNNCGGSLLTVKYFSYCTKFYQMGML